MPKIGRHSKGDPISTSAGGRFWYTGINFQTQTRLRSATWKPFHSQHGPVVVTRPADPEKVAAYRARQKKVSARGRQS
jgi:hypothetical protein